MQIVERVKERRGAPIVYTRVADVLRRRVEAGHYRFRPVPAAPALAEEFGVSLVTMRHAVRVLLDEGRLRRDGRKLVAVCPADAFGHAAQDDIAHVALLAPAYPSSAYRAWLNVLYHAVADRPCEFRLIPYHDWTDPVLTEALSRHDGVFFIPPGGPPPAGIARPLLQRGRRVVSLINDLTEYGCPTLRAIHRKAPHRLMDHLHERGHHRFASFNVQAHDEIIRERNVEWRAWMDAHGLDGPHWDIPPPNDPADTSTPLHPILAARRALAEAGLTPGNAPSARRSHALPFTALFCATAPAALGMLRALREVGLEPGHDVAVVAIDGEGQAEYTHPALTTVDAAIVPTGLLQTLAWMMGDAPWTGPLWIEPEDAPVTVRESSVRRFNVPVLRA